MSPAWPLTLVAAYLFGAIPFSYLVARRRGIDVRAQGSRNVGATNVMRTAGVAAGLLAFLLDFAKGAIAAVIAQRIDPAGGLAPLAALAAVIGHVYPVFLRFQGGKGVATGAGAFVPLAPGAVGAALLAFAASLGLFRYVSLASLVGSFTLVLGCALTASPVTPHAAAVALLIAFKHRENIGRLRAGTERQAFQRKPEAA